MTKKRITGPFEEEKDQVKWQREVLRGGKGTMNEKRFYVIAQHDLEAEPHTWLKGERYECVDKGGYVTLASEEGQANFIKPANNDSWMEGLFIKVKEERKDG